MPTSSSILKSSAKLTIKITGLTEIEAGRVASRLDYMKSVNLLSKEVSVEKRDTPSAD